MDILQNPSSQLVSGNTTALLHPIMYGLTSLLLFGSTAFQAVLGRPETYRLRQEQDLLRRDVSLWITNEEPIALQQLLCNIGSSGCHSAGVTAGLVIASPSQSDPPCKFQRACVLTIE
jgi:hypothetical protein